MCFLMAGTELPFLSFKARMAPLAIYDDVHDRGNERNSKVWGVANASVDIRVESEEQLRSEARTGGSQNKAERETHKTRIYKKREPPSGLKEGN